MSGHTQVDALILGSGTGGTSLALHLARSGQRVAVVEKQWIGGSCPNVSCLPTKNEIWSAKIADSMRRFTGEFGHVARSVAVDMTQVRQRKREMVRALNVAVLDSFDANRVQLIMGEGRFVAPRAVGVHLKDGGTRVVSADRVFLDLGTHAAMPDIAGLSAAQPMTHIEALELDRVPSHLIVLGGGYVGLELAQAFRRFGSRVTIVEHGVQLAGREDPDVGAEIANFLIDEGVDIVTSAEAVRAEGRSGQGVRLAVRSPFGERTLEASDILIAAGRVPNTSGIGLDVAGVDLDDGGYIKVNERLETSASAIWAIGDCAGSPQFTHVSFDDFRIIRDNLVGGRRTTRGRLVPYCMFTDPPLGRVGLNEVEAERSGISVRVAKLPMASVLRTRTTGETTGFMKAIIDAHSDRLLGFTMIGSEAGEVTAVVQAAMLAGLPYTHLRDAILAHPTMAEGLVALLSNVPATSDTRSRQTRFTTPDGDFMSAP